MANESWTIDGVALSGFQVKIQTYAGLDDAPGVAGTNTPRPYISGALWNRKVHAEGKVTMQLTVLNVDPATGIPPAAQDAQRVKVDTALDTLTRVFAQRHRLVTIVCTRSDGTVRQTYGEVLSPVQIGQLAINSAVFSVDWNLPMPFFEDNADQTYNAPVPAVSGTTYTPAAFAAATAPMDSLVYTITGPCTNPKITDIASGFYFQYTGSLAALQTLVVDSKNWTISGTGGFTPVAANFLYTGGRFLTLVPDAITGAQVKMDFTAGSAATTFSVVGRRRYLI